MRDIKDIKLGEGDELLALRDEERYHNGPGGFYLGNQGNGESPVHTRHKYLYSPLVSPEAPSSTFIEHLLCAEYRGASIPSLLVQHQCPVLGQGYRGKPDRMLGPHK